MHGTLIDKVTVVTGASAGIGEAMVHQLVNAGARVVASARRADRLAALAERLGPERVRIVAGDVTDPEVRARILAEADAMGGAWLLVNNAGFGQRGPLELVPESEARRQFEVNVFSLMELTRLFLPGMRARGTGRVMNVSSVVGKVAFPISGWYAATKHALEALSDALRLEVAPFGIDVVLIEPGPIATEFFTVAETTMSKLEGDVGAYESIIQGVHEGRQRNTKGTLTASECAEVMMKAASSPYPCARYPVTITAWLLLFLRWLLPTRLMDAFMRKVLDLPARSSLRGRRRSPHQDVTF